MADTRTRSVPLGVPTLIGTSGFIGMIGVGGEPWQLAVSGILGAVLVSTDIMCGWSAARNRWAGAREAS